MIAPNLALGQNFFNNESLALKISSMVLSGNPQTIIEIGPGTGAFTRNFHEKSEKLILIEKDARLAAILKELYKNSEMINQDFTEIRFNEISSINESNPEKTVIYGSLPYNQSKLIIELCLTLLPANEMYFIIQKEVATQYVDIKGAPYSLYASIFANAKKIQTISPGSFSPKPKVDSALIHFKRNNLSSQIEDKKKFKAFLAKVFVSPRKKVANNLKEHLKRIPAEFKDMRPDQLTIVDFIKLWDIINHNEKS